MGFYINRSELWGLFFARHNPSFYEVLLGTGPFNLGRHYGDIKLQETRSFLLSLFITKYLSILWAYLVISAYFLFNF